MARGLEKPPIWATVLIVASLVGLAVLVPVALGRDTGPTPAQAAAANAAITSARATAEAEAAFNAPVSILVVGDSYTGGSDEGGRGEANWTSIVSGELRSSGSAVQIDYSAGGGSGYTTGGSTNRTFDQLAQEGGGGYDLLIVFGSRNDRTPGDVQGAAAAVYQDLMSSSPGAPLLVIGPAWVDADVPDFIRQDRDAISAAASAAGATFVDPIADGWFTGQYSALIGGDGVHPTDEGHAYMAGLLLPPISAAVGAVRAAR